MKATTKVFALQHLLRFSNTDVWYVHTFQYIYKNETFEKPFFCTYVKTSMFTLYLLGFLFWPPWRDQCSRPTNYTFIDPEQEDEIITPEGTASLVSNFIFK